MLGSHVPSAVPPVAIRLLDISVPLDDYYRLTSCNLTTYHKLSMRDIHTLTWQRPLIPHTGSVARRSLLYFLRHNGMDMHIW